MRPPTPSWGNILNDGYAFIRNTPWLVIAAGIPLVLTTLGFTFLGETLRCPYAQERCRIERPLPQLRPPGQTVRCHFPLA